VAINLPILAACAMATTRILVGTSISSVFCPSAPTIAMAAATPWTIFPSSALFWAWIKP